MADRRRVAPILALLAVAIALVIAGCGGGGDGSSTASISKAEFIREANSVCAKSHRQGESEFRDYLVSLGGDEPQGAALAAAQKEIAETILIPLKQQEIGELRELGNPKGDGSEVKAILGALEEGIETTEKHPQKTVIYTASAFGKSVELAIKYGLSSDC